MRLEDGLFDVLHVGDQAHRPDVDLLRALLDKASAGVRVGVGELLLDLRQAQSVGDQLVGVETNLVLASNAAEGRIVHHIGRGSDVLGDHPVLKRLEFHDVVGRIGGLDRIPVDRADRAEIGTDLRGHVGRKRDRRKALQHLLPVPVVVGIVVEDQIDDRKSRQRGRAHMQQMREAVHLDFDRYGDLLLNFLRSASRPLRNHLDPGVGNIGISFYRKILESDDARYRTEERRHPER